MNRIPKPTEVRYHLDRAYLNEPMRYGTVSLIQIGRLHCTPHTTIETHPHLNWFELTIITDGKDVVGTNGESISVKSGDIHLSFPGDFHQIAADPEDPLKCDFLSFWPEDPALLEELETAARRLYPAKLRLFSDERIAWQVSNAISELNSPASHSELILQSAFLQIVLMLLDDLEQNTDLSAKSMIGHPEELCFQMMYYIGIQAFGGCGKIGKNVYIRSDSVKMGSWVFNNCKNIANVYFYGNAPRYGRQLAHEPVDTGSGFEAVLYFRQYRILPEQ